MKKRIVITVLFVVTVSISIAAQVPNYTMADVAKHNNPTDCWMTSIQAQFALRHSIRRKRKHNATLSSPQKKDPSIVCSRHQG